MAKKTATGIGFCLFFLPLLLAAQWSRGYGQNTQDIPCSIVESQGGFILSGFSQYVLGSTAAQIWVIKMTNKGDILWEHSLECAPLRDDLNDANALVSTPDGGCVFAGTYSPPGRSESFLLALKLSAQGILEWLRIFGAGESDPAGPMYKVHSLRPLDDGGYLVAGEVQSGANQNGQLWTVRLNGAGEVIWQKAFVSEEGGAGYAAVQASDGTLIVGGRRSGRGYSDIWILRLSGDGGVVWQKSFGGPEGEQLHSLEATDDGGCIAAGSTDTFGGGMRDAWVLKLDALGDVEWQRCLGGPENDWAESVLKMDDGYLITGMSQARGNRDFLIAKLSHGGAIVWQKAFGGISGHFSASDETAYSAAAVTGGGFVVAGMTGRLGKFEDDILLLSLSSAGETAGCSYLRSVRVDSSVTGVLPLDTRGRPLDTAAVERSLNVTKIAGAWASVPVCPAKKKAPRR